MAKYEWFHADTCLPDYWGGHHLPHVMIPVYKGMHLEDVKEAIRTEIRQGAIMGNSEEARLLSADMVRPEEEKQADRLTRSAYAAVNKIRPAQKGKRRLFEDLEPLEGYGGDTVYAFFVLAEV